MFATMDTETTEWSHTNLKLKLIFGYICYYDENRQTNVLFHTAKEFFLSVEKMYKHYKKSFLIFTHNFDYDFKFLLRFMQKCYTLKVIDNGLIFSVKCYRTIAGKKKLICEFRNSLRLFPMKLKEMGIAFRLHKLERKFTEENDSFHRYCIRDCNIIYKSLKYMVKFFQNEGFPIEIEKIPLSFPSIAYKLFHKHNSEFEHIDEKRRKKNQLTSICDWINKYFRNFYYGGRCEVFSIAEYEKVAYLDVNSLYPSVMINNKFPKPKYWRTEKRDVELTITEKTFAILCDIDETYEKFPMIAEKVDGKLMFLARKKRSLITIEEYRYIVDKRPNTSLSIVEIWECDAWITPFEYMRELYEKRQQMKRLALETNTDVNPMQFFIKMLLNSTYGKFAERSEKLSVEFYDTDSITSEFAKEKMEKAKEVKFEGKTMIVYNSYDLKYIPVNVVFGHRITALSRLKLATYIDLFESHNVKCIYCDTDSIVTETKNLDSVKPYLDEFELGKMKIEKIYSRFCALAPKEYLFWDKDKRSGLLTQMQKAKGINSGSLFDYYDNGIDYVRPLKYREAIRRKLQIEDAIEIHKNKSSFYDKRIITDSLDTIPIQQISDSIEERNKVLILRQIEDYKKRD